MGPHLPEMDDRAGEGPGDAVDRLDPRDYQLAELVEVAGLGAHDHVVGPVTAWACCTPVMSTICAVTLAALPTSVWIRMYAVTTGTDLLASCRPRRPGETGANGMVACGRSGQAITRHGWSRPVVRTRRDRRQTPGFEPHQPVPSRPAVYAGVCLTCMFTTDVCYDVRLYAQRI
jgi:hypothetical protein